MSGLSKVKKVGVVAGSPFKSIISRSTPKSIITCSPLKRVIARSPIKNIVTCETKQMIIIVCAGESVVFVRTLIAFLTQ